MIGAEKRNRIGNLSVMLGVLSSFTSVWCYCVSRKHILTASFCEYHGSD